MKLRTLLLALACVCVALVQAASPLSLIPLPASVQQGSGQFTFPAKVQLCVPSYTGDSVKAVAKRWAGNFTKSTGIKVSVGKKANAAIQLRLNSGLASEAYDLQVTRERIVIEAARPAGFFYALQTLNQLLPSRAVMAGVKATDVQAWTLPVVTIKDHPRFEWRGFMLDEGRHFYGKEEIKTLLDVMAAYKLNRFHWHLTEDQGWRIEIQQYPLLPEVGAWRNSKVLGWGEVKPDGQRYGGYYTQKDAREIVRYAQERFIEIVPEVDIPGHSQAAVAAYPEFLSCDPQNQHEVWLWQGVSPDVINVSHPQAVQFAKDVIDELTAIFPFRYIHLGGDECPTNKWEANEACRQQLASIGSKNFRDLQINFYRQLQDHIAQKPASEQRQLIFWNEVLHGNTRPLGTDITIMAWVGADGAAKDAAQRGMKTILSPQIPYYINRRQSNLPTEPRSQGHGTETVEAVYNYVPMAGIPADLQQQYMGVQANFWTEWVEEASVVQYLMFPRLAAVAEAGWTPQQLRKYPDFLERLQAEAKYYELRGVDYGKHVFR